MAAHKVKIEKGNHSPDEKKEPLITPILKLTYLEWNRIWTA